MTFQAKLRAHLADADAAWGPDGRDARWTRDGAARLLVLVPRALTASDVVDAHVAGLRDGIRVTVAYDGAATEVARRTAGRLGVELLDAATLPEPVPEAAAPEPAEPAVASPTVEEPPVVEAAIEAAPDVAAPEPVDTLLVAEPAVATPEAEAPTPEPAPTAEPEPLAPVLAVEAPAAEAPAAEAPEPLTVPALPWADTPREPERLPEVIVPPHEMLALPWIAELEEESVEMLPAGRAPRADHPTALALSTKTWGLPWSPRGAPPSLVPAASDALSRNDPALWHQAQRVSRLRSTIAETGASSFGAVVPAKAGAVPSPSAWMARLQVERA